ncbi:MAG TPA: helix-hairpin-helix domain-containing protein [Terracidiphilus sp.]|nr:helix-hairpin-helix domain-containing protein [Terracidiphilus sp.]
MQRRIAHLILAAAVLAAFLAGIGVARVGYAEGRPHGIARTERPSAEDRVDINHASLEQLLAVPGMTRSWAKRIIRFRPYHAKNDLVKRGVVSGDVYERIKDSIVAHRERQPGVR